MPTLSSPMSTALALIFLISPCSDALPKPTSWALPNHRISASGHSRSKSCLSLSLSDCVQQQQQQCACAVCNVTACAVCAAVVKWPGRSVGKNSDTLCMRCAHELR